jgi:UDP-N-acetylglucosamine--N-acetylmuramyl-(pentapeptide) pyrophosphoryl-undecaprenol N-acetylglucosamine transferase
VQAEVLPFIEDMAARLAACDLMVCRAGAITVSELCAAGVPSLLVPLIVSTTSAPARQRRADGKPRRGLHLPQAELSAERLAAELQALTRERCWRWRCQARALARPKAAARVADEIDPGGGAMRHARRLVPPSGRRAPLGRA